MPRTSEKKRLNELFALVGKGLAHANRLELLELLSQGERDVESLAQCSGLSLANTSHHLRLLRQCGLVCNRQDGQRVLYRLADDTVAALLALVHQVGLAQLPELDRLLAARFPPELARKTLTPQALAAALTQETWTIFDLRPALEYEAGHIPGARLATLDSLRALPRAPAGACCAVYCRSAFCLLPVDAAAVLSEKNYEVHQVAGGFSAWRLAGLPVSRG